LACAFDLDHDAVGRKVTYRHANLVALRVGVAERVRRVEEQIEKDVR
jgi:hypothetical protein